jgi:hypothetical protein
VTPNGANAYDDESVLTLYRAAKTVDEKREQRRTLSMMNSEAALQAIDAALEEKTGGGGCTSREADSLRSPPSRPSSATQGKGSYNGRS